MEITVFFLLILWAFKQFFIHTKVHTNPHDASKSRRPYLPVNRFGFVKSPLNIPILLFIGLVLFQIVPLPPYVIKVMSPNTYSLYKESLPGWPEKEPFYESPITPVKNRVSHNQMTAHRDAPVKDINYTDLHDRGIFSSWRTLSIYPYATKTELLKILAYIGIFFLVINTTEIKIVRIVVVIAGIGFFIALLAILQKLTGTTRIYWLRDASYASPFGPYICRNHFAGYIGMAIPLSMGLLSARLARITFSQNITWRDIVRVFESHLLENIMLTFAITIMISALFLSLSRGGMVSFIISIIVFVVLIGLRRTKAVISKGRIVLTSVLVATFAMLLWLGLNPILDRLSNLSSPERYTVYENTFAMAKDFLTCGTGLGSFLYIYPKYKTLTSQAIFDHAHNDYIELFSECGIPGCLILIAAVITFFWKILKRWWERCDPYAKGITLGGICSIIAILFHSFGDFNLHIPANALFLSFILGLIYRTVMSRNVRNSHGKSDVVP